MTRLSAGAVQLPSHHVSIRVPWHDDGWRGTVCKRPKANNSCLALSRIGEERKDEEEENCAGTCWDDLDKARLPVCVSEHAGFMAPFALTVDKHHPYTKTNKLHEHFDRTPFRYDPFSAAAVPFRWMLKSEAFGVKGQQGYAERLRVGVLPDREPELGFDSSWIQERDNQLAVLDTFFGALTPQDSLCFFYAKRTPLSETNRRILIGVGRVKSLGAATEYRYNTKKPPLRCVLWERNVGHSIRTEGVDGFLFPYQLLLDQAGLHGSLNPEDFAARAGRELATE